MSDLKSKLPDLKELTSMTSKLYTDIKKSVGQIIQNYKDKRTPEEKASAEEPAKKTKSEKKPASKVTSTKTDDSKK